MPPEVHFGPRALEALVDALRSRKSQRVLLLTGPERRFVDVVSAALEGFDVQVFDGAEVHVPEAVVTKARAVVGDLKPDALVALGGGAATGLGKALRLELDLPFLAVPTTYAGSEMTRIFGITSDADKRTGREDRVRPEAVFYYPDFVAGLPTKLEVQSLLNALAHPISALSTDSLDASGRRLAFDAIGKLVGAALQLAETPGQLGAKTDGLRGASMAGRVLDEGRMGLHHRLAHFVGGRFTVPHAPLHAVLLPHFVRTLADTAPELYAEIEAAAGIPDVPAQLFDLLRRVGAPTSLVGLGVDREAVVEAVSASADLPAGVVQSALLGRRPSTAVSALEWGLGTPVVHSGAALEEADTVVVAVHGRGGTAESIIGRLHEAAGHGEGLAVVAPQASTGAWYDNSYRDAAETIGAPLTAALDNLDAVLAKVAEAAPRARKVAFGFSQGACLLLEHLAVRKPAFDAVVALSGARIGPADAYSALGDFGGVDVLVGVAESDSWVDAADVRATAAQLAAAGADVDVCMEPGDVHHISARQRIRAGAVVRGEEAPEPMRGYGSAHETEALPGALPRRVNTPRRAKYGLYSEQINATGFVAKRHENVRSWVYKVRPSAQHRAFEKLEHSTFGGPLTVEGIDPNLIGYAPLEVPETPTDFVDGLATFGGAGAPDLRRGFAIHLYVANRSMENRSFYDSDGDLLIIPQLGALTLLTEMGVLSVPPGKIAIVPRGLKFSVLLEDGPSRGYVAEVYGRHFELPERGPIGANGLTEARHFESPQAWYEDRLQPDFKITNKFGGGLYETTQDYSPYDVVAWHGNWTPYVYDLLDFAPVGYTRFDHPDPSIYTVLAAPMDEQGADTLDFVFFPPRWDISEDTFRPPFFHRNSTTEFNGIIKMPRNDGPMFQPGCYFVTPSMTAHGVLAHAVQRVFNTPGPDKAERMTDSSMWFQFETTLPITLTPWALASANRLDDWFTRWGTYRNHFNPSESSED